MDPPISWNDIISEYENIKTQQINYQWALLNRTFRGVLLDDETRVGFDNVFLIKHDSEELILGIGNKIQQCLDQTSCTKPTLSETEIQFFSPSRHFKFYISILDDANRSFSDKESIFQNFPNSLITILNLPIHQLKIP